MVLFTIDIADLKQKIRNYKEVTGKRPYVICNQLTYNLLTDGDKPMIDDCEHYRVHRGYQLVVDNTLTTGVVDIR